MKKTIVVLFGLISAVSCGGTPTETAYQLNAYGLFCDSIHQCFNADPSLKNIPYSFYLGQNAADCKAAFNESDADSATRAIFSTRKLVQAQADLCLQAIKGLDCTAWKEIAARYINTEPYGLNTELGQSIFKDARAKLGVAVDYDCNLDTTTCRPGACSLATNAGACAPPKVAPLKDATLAQKETEAYAMPMTKTGCGNLPW